MDPSRECVYWLEAKRISKNIKIKNSTSTQKNKLYMHARPQRRTACSLPNRNRQTRRQKLFFISAWMSPTRDIQ